MTNANSFDPAAWLSRWKAAGGAWAGPHLLPLAGDPAALHALARELDDKRHAAQNALAALPAPSANS